MGVLVEVSHSRLMLDLRTGLIERPAYLAAQ